MSHASRRFLLIVGLAIFIVGCVYIAFRQHIRMHLAERHVPKVASVLGDDASFTRIRCGVFTGVDGSLLIQGQVPDAKTFERLRALVTSTRPPVTTVYKVFSDTGTDHSLIEEP